MQTATDAAGGIVAIALLVATACSQTDARFPLREPLRQDTDLRSFRAPCRTDDSGQPRCLPEEYVSPLVWDGADNLLFRPLAEAFAVEGSTEAVNANSLDEVADSAWFTERLGTRAFGIDELRQGACKPEQVLRPDTAPAGSWLIDKGKPNGASPGFRWIRIPLLRQR